MASIQRGKADIAKGRVRPWREIKKMFEVDLSREAENIYLKANPKTTRLLDNCFRPLEESPWVGHNIKPLKGKLEGSFRYQIGGTRVVYNVDLELRKVFGETIGPRGDVYK